MYAKTLKEILTVRSLKQAWAKISRKPTGLDQVSVEMFEEDLHGSITDLREEVLSGHYTPEPLSRIYIPKENTTQLRPLGLGALGDKLIQKTIALDLGEYFDRTFSDKSYGYRPGKSATRAIARTRDYLQRGFIHIYRLDIDNFFETIAHDRLFGLLERQIADPALRQVILLFVQNGSFQHYKYLEHTEGIHQGDPLSPLLANLYLHQVDRYLDERNVAFVRFADDTVIFAKTKETLMQITSDLTDHLSSLALMPHPRKSGYHHAVKEGFDFLGISFVGTELSIEKNKLDSIIYRLTQTIQQTETFSQMQEKLNQQLNGLQAHYFAIFDEKHPQYKLILDALLLSLSKRVTVERKQGNITTKKAFRSVLMQIELPHIQLAKEKKDFIERIISRGLEGYLATKKYKTTRQKIARKKKEYTQKYAAGSVMYISEVGTFLGVSKNTIVLKQKGKVIYRMPKYRCERIIIASASISLSAALVKLCADQGIAIDFFDRRQTATPYASLYTAKNAYARMSLRQLKLLETPAQMTLARAFIKGKIKNQINYLKYLDKYHRILEEPIHAMERGLADMLAHAATPNDLMLYEGRTAMHYWQALSAIVEDKVSFTGRITYGATDLVNSALNYGYALLYSRIQYHAVRAGLSLHISFLHALDDTKPTLVYDMIEEFRAFVVDRTIFTMINQREPLKLDKDHRLDTRSRQLITRKVLERIGAHTRHRHATKKIDTIISEQAYLLARAVRGLSRYRPFIGKY